MLLAFGCAASTPQTQRLESPEPDLNATPNCGELRHFDAGKKECVCDPIPFVLTSPDGDVPLNVWVLSPNGAFKAAWVLTYDPETGIDITQLQVKDMTGRIVWRRTTDQRKGFVWGPGEYEFIVVEHFQDHVSLFHLFNVRRPDVVQTVRMKGGWPHVVALSTRGPGMTLLDDCSDSDAQHLLWPPH